MDFVNFPYCSLTLLEVVKKQYNPIEKKFYGQKGSTKGPLRVLGYYHSFESQSFNFQF